MCIRQTGLISALVLFQAVSLLCGGEPVQQGVKQSWNYTHGAKFNENGTEVVLPVKNGCYIFTRSALKKGLYKISFEYKFRDLMKPEDNILFSFTGGRGLYTGLLITQVWMPVELYAAVPKDGAYKIGFGMQLSAANEFYFRNFILSKCTESDFEKINFPVENPKLWINRSTDRKNTIILAENAENHLTDGKMLTIQPRQGKTVKGVLTACYLEFPLPAGHQYRLSFWCKSDVPGNLNAGLWGNRHTFPVETSWKKYSFNFERKGGEFDISGITFTAVTENIRKFNLKDAVLERIK